MAGMMRMRHMPEVFVSSGLMHDIFSPSNRSILYAKVDMSHGEMGAKRCGRV